MSDPSIRVRGDLHGHTDWSDGRETLLTMATAAIERGYEYWACTDHSPRLTVAHGLSPERLESQLRHIDDINSQLAVLDPDGLSAPDGPSAPGGPGGPGGTGGPGVGGFRVLTGIEVDIFEDGTLDCPDELLSRLDVVVASCHRAFTQERSAMTKRLLTAATHPHVDILGHISNRKLWAKGYSKARPESEFDHAEVFAACAQHHTAIELNSQAQRMDPPRPWVSEAAQFGCWFALSTDAHNVAEMDRMTHSVRRAEEAGVSPSRILNGLPRGELLTWLGRA